MLESQPLLRLCRQNIHLNTQQVISQYEIFYFGFLALLSLRFTFQDSSPPTCSRIYLLSSTQRLRIPLAPSCSQAEFSLCLHHHVLALRATKSHISQASSSTVEATDFQKSVYLVHLYIYSSTYKGYHFLIIIFIAEDFNSLSIKAFTLSWIVLCQLYTRQNHLKGGKFNGENAFI